MEKCYLTAKFAAETDPAEIPLPSSLPPPENDFRSSRFNRPSSALPSEYKALPTTAVGVSGILKNKKFRSQGMIPGVPVGPLPTLSDIDSECDDDANLSELEEEADGQHEAGEITDDTAKKQHTEARAPKKVTFAEQDEADTGREIAEKWPHIYPPFPPPHPNVSPYPMVAPIVQSAGFISSPAFPSVAPTEQSNMPLRMPFIGPLNPAVDPSHAAYLALQTNGPVIEAQPQLRNVQQEVTRLVPTSVRIRKTSKPARAWSGSSGLVPTESPGTLSYYKKRETPQKTAAVSREEVYQQFMAELEGLL
ncbi:hypothetical protein D918_01044 [Trichuris suis]|nr:hypothetical protein D918_01044 [Trichuris suis]